MKYFTESNIAKLCIEMFYSYQNFVKNRIPELFKTLSKIYNQTVIICPTFKQPFIHRYDV